MKSIVRNDSGKACPAATNSASAPGRRLDANLWTLGIEGVRRHDPAAGRDRGLQGRDLMSVTGVDLVKALAGAAARLQASQVLRGKVGPVLRARGAGERVGIGRTRDASTGPDLRVMPLSALLSGTAISRGVGALSDSGVRAEEQNHSGDGRDCLTHKSPQNGQVIAP